MTLQQRFALRLWLALALAFSANAQTRAPPPLEEQLAQANARLADWAQLARYRNDNAALAPAQTRVVFMGDSITDFWGRGSGDFFPGKPYVNRGISGQITGQMLIRMRPDVIALHPAVVVILAGTNDIGNNVALHDIEDNLSSMVELALAHHIKVVLASLLPTNDYSHPDQSRNRPPQKIRELNAWMRTYAQQKGQIFLDYYPALLDATNVLRNDFSDDGLHPNAAGYAAMSPLAQRAIQAALGKL